MTEQLSGTRPAEQVAPAGPGGGHSHRDRVRRPSAVGPILLCLVAGLAGGGVALTADRLTTNPAVTTTASAPTEVLKAGGSSAATAGVEGVAREVTPSVVLLQVQGDGQAGEGSGIILSSTGEILTNNHVASLGGKGGQITVVFSDGKAAPATVVGTDPVTDLAVVQAHGVHGLQPAGIGSSDDLQVGQPVVAIGAPLGLQGTVTSGIVSALNRPVSTTGENGQGAVIDAIQTDAAINPGNSGGPLVDMQGRVVAIDSAIASLSSSASSQSGSIGLGFAIPISQAMPIVSQLEQGQTATHAQLGISVGDSSRPEGALVADVKAGSSAAAAGLQQGDVITKVDSTIVGNADALIAAIRAERPGDKVTVTYQREGGSDTVTVALGSDQPGA